MSYLNKHFVFFIIYLVILITHNIELEIQYSLHTYLPYLKYFNLYISHL